jgi:protein-arginine kinase activator protein McsA
MINTFALKKRGQMATGLTRSEICSRAAQAKNEKFRKEREARISSGEWDSLMPVERRMRILLEQQFRCALCGIKEEWNSQPLKFELDHISGDRKNESRENLRLICPNCHSQTETYKVANFIKKGVRYTDEEIILALQQSVSAYEAMKKLGMNPHGGNYIRLRKIVKTHNLVLGYNF